VPLAYFTEDVLFFDSRLLFSAPSLSPLADAWAPLVSSFFHPALANPSCATAVSHHVRPLRAAAPPFEMPPRAVTHPTITPPPSSHALTHRNELIYSAIEATPLAGRYPTFTAPAPLPGPIKATPTTPEESRTSPALLSSSPAPERTPNEHRPPPVIPLCRAAVSPPPEL
jgi:hypothetical protein